MIAWTPDMDAAIRRLRSRGLNWEAIAERIGVCPEGVRRRAREIGVPTRRLNCGPVSGERLAAGAKPPRETRVGYLVRRPGLSPRWTDRSWMELSA